MALEYPYGRSPNDGVTLGIAGELGQVPRSPVEFGRPGHRAHEGCGGQADGRLSIDDRLIAFAAAARIGEDPLLLPPGEEFKNLEPKLSVDLQLGCQG